jgi:hydroxymethylpyrimidine/phosphomethylpyrimidine kinase
MQLLSTPGNLPPMLKSAMAKPTPIAVTIAGSDCSGGAGLQADLKTFQRFGTYGMSAVTAVVAESPFRVSALQAVSPRLLLAQLRDIFACGPVAAAKTGMLFSPSLIRTVAAFWRQHARRVPLVVDPVLVATTGDTLQTSGAATALLRELIPLAAVVTPNLPEARALLEAPGLSVDSAAREAWRRWRVPVLVKGGHAAGPWSVDVLADARGLHRFRTRRIDAAATHGTGCALSAAITAGLAHHRDLPTAIRLAKIHVTRAIRDSIDLGSCHALRHSV